MLCLDLKLYLFICLFLRVAKATTIRQVQLSRKLIDVASVELQGTDFSCGSAIQCLKSCVDIVDKCFSVMYWKTERKCKVNLSAYINVRVVASSDVSWFVLKDPTTYTYYEDIGRWLVYRHGSKTWKDAETSCNSASVRSRLFMVDSQQKQDVAKKIAENSGKIFVHIGVYHDLNVFTFPPESTWKYSDGSKVSYTCWANILEPKFPTWGALEKFSGYKWAAVEPVLLTGGWICERY